MLTIDSLATECAFKRKKRCFNRDIYFSCGVCDDFDVFFDEFSLLYSHAFLCMVGADVLVPQEEVKTENGPAIKVFHSGSR